MLSGSWLQSDTCNRTFQTANQTKSFQLSLPIDTIEYNNHSSNHFLNYYWKKEEEKNWGISKTVEFDTLDMVPTGDVWPKCIFFPKIVTVMIVYD